MSLFNLIARLTLDGKGFKSGIREAEVGASNFAKKRQGSSALEH